MIVLGVPTLNRYDLCAKLVASAFGGTRPPDLVVVVDNGGRFGWAHDGSVEILRPGRNLGVGPSWNLLARRHLKSQDDQLLICGDDVTLHPDAVEKLVATMVKTNADLTCPEPTRSTMYQMFSCFLVRPSLFEKVGYFDEMFWPAYFEDNDFHRRMKLAGAAEAIAPCGYDHLNSGTMQKYTKDELEKHHERFRVCRDYYIEKWGGLPGAERFTVPFDGKLQNQMEF
jgi:GT2 family glycosyltransferase